MLRAYGAAVAARPCPTSARPMRQTSAFGQASSVYPQTHSWLVGGAVVLWAGVPSSPRGNLRWRLPPI